MATLVVVLAACDGSAGGGAPAAGAVSAASAAASTQLAASASASTTTSEPAPSASTVAALRCGWFENPTPGNAWLTDGDGEWLIGTQGGDQAEGDWPDFAPGHWVRTSGNYGHGCACMRVEVNAAKRTVTRIVSSASRPLADCRADPKLKEPRRD